MAGDARLGLPSLPKELEPSAVLSLSVGEERLRAWTSSVLFWLCIDLDRTPRIDHGGNENRLGNAVRSEEWHSNIFLDVGRVRRWWLLAGRWIQQRCVWCHVSIWYATIPYHADGGRCASQGKVGF